MPPIFLILFFFNTIYSMSKYPLRNTSWLRLVTINRFVTKPGYLKALGKKSAVKIWIRAKNCVNLFYYILWPKSLIWAVSQVAAKAAQYLSWWINSVTFSKNRFQLQDIRVPALEEAITIKNGRKFHSKRRYISTIFPNAFSRVVETLIDLNC